MNQRSTSARVKKQLSFGKSSVCLQTVLLMTLRHALKAISSNIAECSLDVPIFNSMLLSDGINRMQTQCLGRGKLCEQHTVCEQDAHSICSHVPTTCRRRDPRDHATACLPQSTSD